MAMLDSQRTMAWQPACDHDARGRGRTRTPSPAPTARRTPALALLAVPLLAASAAAQIEVGSELQINSYTTTSQNDPEVAVAADGSFVVVWDSFQGADGDDFRAVNGRRFSASGAPLGADFQVNTYTTEAQGSPAVAATPGGSFVVVWENFEYVGSSQIDDIVNIRARIYDANGNGGGEIFANEPPDEAVYNPDVAMDGNGNFVVVWEGFYGNDDGSGGAIHGQRFSANGAAIGGNFLVNTYTTYNQTYPVVSTRTDGAFVVVWQSSGSDGSNYAVRARRFAANGAPQGNDFPVNTLTNGFQGRPDVAMDSSGGFTVVWQSFASGGNDSDQTSIQWRRYDAAGDPIGADFQVNTYITAGQGNPTVSRSSLGTFVTWESGGSAGTDSSPFVNTSLQRRAFTPGGLPRSDDVQVNTYTTSFQSKPAVAMNESGQVVVVWESLGSAFTDSDGFSIQGQRFLVPLFADGFESGGVTAWSSSSP